ncbi:MAG: class I SAM-dependent methyltransferase [Betaproteobacteria bacterium]
MDEARKTNALRGPAFAGKYLRGRVIDIGAGNDLVCANAEGFDIGDGDANVISRFRQVASYDTVHSSHCLEHMHDPAAALREWWSLLKPGGYLVVVVPDEDLYEQGIWPSIFNRDHKTTFRLGGDSSWSGVSHDIRKLIDALPGCEIVSAEIQDMHYDYSLRMRHGEVRRKRPWWLRIGKSLGKRLPLVGPRLHIRLENMAVRHGVPVDQTTREAVAQIQVVARKVAA